MNRRTLLRRLGIAGLAGLAGCTGGSETDSPTRSPTETATPTTAQTESPTATATDSPTDTATATDSPTDTATDTPTATATDSPTGTPTATDSPTDTPTATDSPTATATSSTGQVVAVAPEGELIFDPAEFTIRAGETVRWEWQASNHNVAIESQPSGSDWSGHADQLYGAGHVYEYTFETTGAYEYFCEPHENFGMVGSFTVE